MFAQIEIDVLESAENAQTLGVKISKNGVDLEASMMLRGQYNLCGHELRAREMNVEAALEAVRSTLRSGERLLTGGLLDIAHNTNAPVVVVVRQGKEV
jgi:hypothetical protein